MRIVFIVQGEGRGHITQAISLFQQLQHSRHEVVACLVGTKNNHGFTSIIETEITVPVHYFSSPNLIYNKAGKGLSLRNTAKENFLKIPEFLRNLKKIKNWMNEYKPDLIINFYDLLSGFYQIGYPFSAPPQICIGHQYLLLHNDFVFPENNRVDRFLVNANSRFTAMKAKKMLALSFNSYKNHNKIVSIPPLIRKAVLEEQIGESSFYLAYLTNENLLSELTDWHVKNSQIEVHCFIKTSQSSVVKKLHENFYIHQLDAEKFLKFMASSKGLITTAGFESVCEALYFGKPVMMVPVPNHYEQTCNALDASRYGAGIAQNNFNLDQFITYTSGFKSPMIQFRDWLNEGKSKLIDELDVFELDLSATG
jgi:uncharacterized protein (TIGR00661 family)